MGAVFLDIARSLGYIIDEKWCYRQTVPPSIYKEVTAGVESWRLLLFISNDLHDQRDESDDDSTKLKQLGPCNHMPTPFSSELGAKKITPEEWGNRLPYLVAPKKEYHSFLVKAREKA
jgi:hypothetical protein